MTPPRHSRIYEGRVRHRRFAPVEHAFTYRLFQLYLDLDELPTLFDGMRGWALERPALASFRRADYAADPATPLDTHLRDLVAGQTGSRPTGPIRMLTHLRYFGYCFNPVTFYYCFDPTGERVEAIVAEITNTPWGERHSYVLPESANLTPGPRKRFRFGKAFHVSPFMPMEIDYDWRFGTPGERLTVHMINLRGGARHFDATLDLQAQPVTAATLRRALWHYPCMTARVMAAIYWQALRLRLKGVPHHPHPAKKTAADAHEESPP